MENPIRTRLPLGRHAAIGIGIVAFVAIALALFLTATNRRRPVNTVATEATPAAVAGIPPIDTEVPTETKTATFALG
jgi:hypothetical protein